MKKLITLLLALMLLTCACAEPMTMIPNPWTDTTADGLMQTLGVAFGVPENAENVIFRMLESWSLAEMQFDIEGTHFNARIQPTAAFEDISGMYSEWTSDEPVSIGWCEGRLLYAFDGETATDLLLWYDAAPGLMYSLSALSAEGADLLPIAETVYLITQDDADGAPSLDEILLSCATYAGTAGASLKEANAACALAAFAIESCAAENDLTETVNAALGLIGEELRAELAFNLDCIRILLDQTFDDFGALRGVYETAGCLETMEAIVNTENAQANCEALLNLLIEIPA